MTTVTVCSSVNEAKILNGFPYFADRTATIEVQPYLAGQFTVTETFNDGTTEIRHQETRENCPTVQKFEAGLGDIQTVTKKLKSNEILLASTGQNTNHPILSYFDGKFDNYLQSNPNHCLVVWGIKDTNDVPFKTAQICSAKNSPPPEIVSIGCQKEQCPDNTCEVVCNDHICCYNSQGFPVKTINR